MPLAIIGAFIVFVVIDLGLAPWWVCILGAIGVGVAKGMIDIWISR
jgi:hypothetical protein